MEYGGMVIIAGSLPHDRLRIRARKLASEVGGVNLVVKDIKVEPIQQRRVDVHTDWTKGHIGVTNDEDHCKEVTPVITSKTKSLHVVPMVATSDRTGLRAKLQPLNPEGTVFRY